jgi:hypothetical protein
MSDLIKITHLKREAFKNMAATQKARHFGEWLKDKEFKPTGAKEVQIRDDRETLERLKPVLQELYPVEEVCIP